MRLSTDELAAATDGEVIGDVVEVEGASIDTRGDVAGRLFVPIVAARDGHDFIDTAVATGAAAYLTSRDDRSGRPAVRVDDTLDALLDLGRLARRHLGDRVVGITGSVGKTSTKDLLAAVLGTTWRTTANKASFNNEMGVPLTLLDAPDGTEAVITEMGARGVGHIAMLCDIASPTVGIVTAIEGAHLEQFGSLEQVAVAKGELVEALPHTGTAVLNADQDLVASLASRTRAQVVRYGVHARSADVVAEGVTLDDELRARFTLRSAWGSTPVRLAVRGRHQVGNALAAASAGLALGVSIERVGEALAGASLSPMRMDLRRRADGLLVLDDSYNANPASTSAALHAMAELPVRRRVAVLGVMAELGADEAAGHERVARLAESLGVDVIAVGSDAYGGPGVERVADVAAARERLGELGLGDGDAVLVKGSRVAGLERVAQWLRTGADEAGSG
jgi:UDP-N-acetylmuramoyl-tripeptide--D-alanyl-D-alanine ligase